MKPSFNPSIFARGRDEHMELARSFRRTGMPAFARAAVQTARLFNRNLVQLRRSLKEYP